jgi:hypothetical protein
LRDRSGRESIVYAISQDLGASVELAARSRNRRLQEFDAALATFARRR